MARLLRNDTVRMALLALLVCGAAAIAPGPCAQAQSDDGEPQRLFREGIALREAGDASGAIERLRAAHRLEPSDRTAYNLAAALADGGRVVEARALLRRIIARPRELLIADAARDLLARVTPRIASVSLTIESADRDIRLLVDGAASPAGPSGTRAVSLDPGTHRFEVRDPGGTVLARSEVDVGEGERRSLVLRPVASAARTARASGALGTGDATMPVTRADDDTWLWIGVGTGVAAAVTVAIVIAAVVLGGQGSGTSIGADLPEVVVRGRDE